MASLGRTYGVSGSGGMIPTSNVLVFTLKDVNQTMKYDKSRWRILLSYATVVLRYINMNNRDKPRPVSATFQFARDMCQARNYDLNAVQDIRVYDDGDFTLTLTAEKL